MTRAASPRREEPPPGSPWDDPIDEAPLVFVDLEMTGLRAATDRVIEVCAERVRGDRVEDRIATLVRPEAGEFGNAHVHGIDPAALVDAPTFSSISGAIDRLLDGAVMVAHAAPWDIAFIEAEMARAGRPRRIPFYLDTLTMSRRAFALPSHSLTALSAELGIARARAHRAEDDVHALREVWKRTVAVLAPKSPRDLWHVRIAERHARPELVAAAVRAAEAAVPVRIRYRPARKGRAKSAGSPPGTAAGEDLTVVVTAVRTDLDPPRVLGYLLPSRSRRELRADRILAIEAAGEPPENS